MWGNTQKTNLARAALGGLPRLQLGQLGGLLLREALLLLLRLHAPGRPRLRLRRRLAGLADQRRGTLLLLLPSLDCLQLLVLLVEAREAGPRLVLVHLHHPHVHLALLGVHLLSVLRGDVRLLEPVMGIVRRAPSGQ